MYFTVCATDGDYGRLADVKTVIYVNGLERYPDKRLLAGVRSFAEEKGLDVLPVPTVQSPGQLSRLVDMWDPAGFVVNCSAGTNKFPLSAFAGRPVVFMGDNEKVRDQARYCLRNDANATAEMAARELISLRLKTYAYVTWTSPLYWSGKRLAGFESVLSLHGAKPRVFDSTRFNEGDAELVAALSDWLASLEGPVGVFAANDRMAATVVHACLLAKLSIPRDVSIIGVDDDEELCENTKPTLSSISLDFFAAGRIAAQTLCRLVSGSASSETGTYPPFRVVRRESTRRFQRPDKTVTEALERIRREACSGLAARDILGMFDCSRRSAEMRFQAAVGHSIMREILKTRLETAQNLLQDRNLSMDRIAGLCGYKSNAAFSNFFRAETGQTPSSWRKGSKASGCIQ